MVTVKKYYSARTVANSQPSTDYVASELCYTKHLILVCPLYSLYVIVIVMRTTTLPHNDWDSKEMAPVGRLVVLDMATLVLYVRTNVHSFWSTYCTVCAVW